ncbi:hypothetical protein [Pseudomonas cannabina]|nr:hypothetical protein [Pseudomonas cannabina]
MIRMMGTLLGFGFKPANNEADQVLTRCLNEPAGNAVSVPWLGQEGLNRTGRLAAIASIAGGSFGLAKKGNAYKFYYRRALAGFRFAEIWTIWKSAAFAAPLVVCAMSVADGRSGAAAFAQFVVGFLTTILFLPRGLLGVGTHFSAAATTGKASYGPSGVLNLAMGLYGMTAVITSSVKNWDIQGFAQAFAAGEMYLANNSLRFYLQNELLGVLAFMLVLAFAFWYVSFQYVGARASAEKVFNILRVRASTVYDLYPGSLQESATVLKAPQVALGFLAYVVFVIGLILKPAVTTVMGLGG